MQLRDQIHKYTAGTSLEDQTTFCLPISLLGVYFVSTTTLVPLISEHQREYEKDITLKRLRYKKDITLKRLRQFL